MWVLFYESRDKLLVLSMGKPHEMLILYFEIPGNSCVIFYKKSLLILPNLGTLVLKKMSWKRTHPSL